MDVYEAVRDRLMQLLGERKMSVHALAIECAVPPSTIKNILYGKSRNPGVVTLKALCDGLHISLCEFFGAESFSRLDDE